TPASGEITDRQRTTVRTKRDRVNWRGLDVDETGCPGSAAPGNDCRSANAPTRTTVFMVWSPEIMCCRAKAADAPPFRDENFHSLWQRMFIRVALSLKLHPAQPERVGDDRH